MIPRTTKTHESRRWCLSLTLRTSVCNGATQLQNRGALATGFNSRNLRNGLYCLSLSECCCLLDPVAKAPRFCD
jgi:hypothetical protein